jgi:hypothetical protein
MNLQQYNSLFSCCLQDILSTYTITLNNMLAKVIVEAAFFSEKGTDVTTQPGTGDTCWLTQCLLTCVATEKFGNVCLFHCALCC